MQGLYLIIAAFSGSAQSVISGFYNKKKSSPFKCGIFQSISVMLFFAISKGFVFDFSGEMMIWAIMFGVMYMISLTSNQLAIKTGGVPLTALVGSYSLIIPTTFAIFVYGEYPATTFYIGLLFLLVSLFFVGYPRKDKTKKQVTPLWLLWVTIAFICNGSCSLLQTHYQKLSGGLHRSEFMIVAMCVGLVGFIVASLVDKTEYEAGYRRALMGVGTGVFNGIVNLLVMVLVGMMSPSILFPLYSGISLITSTVASRIFFKKNPDFLSYIAIGIGIVAIVLLNI